MANLFVLNLKGNPMGNKGIAALVDAIGKGSLASIKSITLGGIHITETGKKAMRDAAAARGFTAFV